MDLALNNLQRLMCPKNQPTNQPTTTLGRGGAGSDGSKGVLYIPQNSSITENSPKDRFELYPGHLFEESYPFAERQSMYSAAPVLARISSGLPFSSTHYY